MKKVLLLDTNFSASPILNALKKHGLQVSVCGNNDRDYLCSQSDTYLQVDYSDIDALRAKIGKYDYLVPGCNDLSYLICSQIKPSVFSMTDSYDVAMKIFDKSLFRDLCARLNVPSPRVFKTEIPENCYPVIVKPTDSFSGRGVSIVHSNEELDKAKAFAESQSNDDTSIIETFVKGSLASHSAFIQNGRIEVDFFVDEYCIFNPYAVDISHISRLVSNEMRFAVRSAIQKIVDDLQLVDGLFHTQFIHNGNEFWLIEATRRCPGDLYSRLIEMSTGFPYAEAYACLASGVGMEFREFSQSGYESDKSIVRHTFNYDMTKLVPALSFVREISLREYIPLYRLGETARNRTRIAVGFFECKTQELGQFVDDIRSSALYHYTEDL